HLPVAHLDSTREDGLHLGDVLDKNAVRNRGGHDYAELGRYMRRYLHPGRARQVADLQCWGDAADPSDIGLQDIERARPNALVKRRRTIETLAARAGDGTMKTELVVGLKVGRRHRLFNPVEVQRLEP